MSLTDVLEREAQAVAELLENKKLKLVLVESCTGGLISASLTLVPGISKNFCGGWVVYREASKNKWLGISKAFLAKNTDVNELTSERLSCNALSKTPESSIALSITGHLGPNAPKHLDGKCFISLAYRGKKKIRGEISDSKMHRKRDYQFFNRSFDLDENSFTRHLNDITRTKVNKNYRITALRRTRQQIASVESLSMVRQLLEQLI